MRGTPTATIALAILVGLLACCTRFSWTLPGENGWKYKVKEFKDLLGIATKLDSAGMQLTDTMKDEAKNERKLLIYSFFREPKSAHCIKQFRTARRVANEFRIKGISYVKEIKTKQGNWLSNFFGGSLNDMKKLAKFDPYLQTVVARYEKQSKGGKLEDFDVDCDMVKLQIKVLHSILFILQSDIKFLIMEDGALINRAIYETLKADKFVAKNNFYETVNPTPKQRDLLLKYYTDRVDQSSTKIVQGIDHFEQPGEFVLGRLLDSCQTVSDLHANLKDQHSGYDSICPASTSDPNGNLFTREHKPNKFDETFEFCQELLDAL